MAAFGQQEIEQRLIYALAQPLPGSAAQRLMAAVPRPGWDPKLNAPAGRAAAVLLLIYPATAAGNESPSIVLTERTDLVESHKRQISFPGGTLHPGESAEAAALRETEEEIGVACDTPRILGRLTTLWVPATGFTIQPVVAVAAVRPAFRVNPHEVASVIEVAIASLLDPRNAKLDISDHGKRWQRRPYFDLGRAHLWGASAMITAELLALLGWPGPSFA